MGKRGEVYTDRLDIPNGRRSYFFNVKENRTGDYFVNIVESVKKLGDKFERQEILVYEEHLEEFKDKIDTVIQQLRLLSTQRKDRKEQYGNYHRQDEDRQHNDYHGN